LQKKRSYTLKDGEKVVFSVCSSIVLGKENNALYNNFTIYKKLGIEYKDFPAPTKEIQDIEDSLVDIFGKDKPTEFPKPESKKQNAYHVHIFDDDKSVFYKWKRKPQIRRSSNSLLFYSAFIYQKTYYFYILKITKANGDMDNDGHQPFKEKDQKSLKDMLKSAQIYKKEVTSKK